MANLENAVREYLRGKDLGDVKLKEVRQFLADAGIEAEKADVKTCVQRIIQEDKTEESSSASSSSDEEDAAGAGARVDTWS